MSWKSLYSSCHCCLKSGMRTRGWFISEVAVYVSKYLLRNAPWHPTNWQIPLLINYVLHPVLFLHQLWTFTNLSVHLLKVNLAPYTILWPLTAFMSNKCDEARFPIWYILLTMCQWIFTYSTFFPLFVLFRSFTILLISYLTPQRSIKILW